MALVNIQAMGSEPGSIELEWDPVQDSRVANYRVHYGQSPGNYDQFQDVGMATSTTISNLVPDAIYYFSVKATDGYSEESDFSNELTSGRFRYLFGTSDTASGGPWVEVANMKRSHEQFLPAELTEPDAIHGQPIIATGDIDGDGRDEVVIGYIGATDTSPSRGGLFRVLDDDFTPLTWGVVSWPDYAAATGDTYPALGDLDGDGRAEILVGLGTGGAGLVEVFAYSNGALAPRGWTEVDWPEYNAASGATYPALGNLDGEGADELVIGLHAVDSPAGIPGGTFLIKTGIDISPPAEGSTEAGTIQLSPGLQGRLLAEQGLTFEGLSWIEYAHDVGETRPALGDLDGDGTDELVMGFGVGGNGYLEVFDYTHASLVSLGLIGVNFPNYNRLNGETRAAIGDIDNDGRGEILVGLGPEGEGVVEVIDDSFESFSSSERFQVGAEVSEAPAASAQFQVGAANETIANTGTWPAYKRERATP
ncbi:fibronectin type III domain-containing protein [Thiocystis violacea]|uniref:fibronectin type III domain-containing protein n=1 Tax=Thiocystis violacea TaxID=13725 RepID=UPI001904875A|nr:fibronectin type III domain-containing protein [Thiocystis violacea]